MGATYDIFKAAPGEGETWIGSVEGLEEAIERTKRLAKTNPGDYSLHDLYRSKVIFRFSSKPEQVSDLVELSKV